MPRPPSNADLDEAQRRYFRRRLSEARAAAFADTEGFLKVVHAIEELGRYLTKKPKGHGLAAYSSALVAFVSHGGEASGESFAALLNALREARNDAAHVGAAARRVTQQATEAALILEAATDSGPVAARLVQHYMVESVARAESWQTVEMVRHTMLRFQFSQLPFEVGGSWKLLTDGAVVRFLSRSRTKRLGMTLDDAASSGLVLVDAKTSRLGSSVLPDEVSDAPVLVIDQDNHLRGLITPFDLL